MATIKWEAAEYVQHQKKRSWYVGLIIIGIVSAGLALWLGYWSFSVLIIVSVIALIVYSVRPPRILKYELSDRGILEDGRRYDFVDFRAFSVERNDTSCAVIMIPRKRFSPSVKIYFPEEKGEKIVDVFGGKLPMEELKLDFLDKIVSFLRI